MYGANTHKPNEHLVLVFNEFIMYCQNHQNRLHYNWIVNGHKLGFHWLNKGCFHIKDNTEYTCSMCYSLCSPYIIYNSWRNSVTNANAAFNKKPENYDFSADMDFVSLKVTCSHTIY